MPRDFFVVDEARGEYLASSPVAFWLLLDSPPSQSDSSEWLNDCCGLLARLRPDSSLADLKRELDRIASVAPAMAPALAPLMEEWGFRLDAMPVAEYALQYDHAVVRERLLLFQAAVGIVLLVCCINLTTLLVGRVFGRLRELAVRASLGASRARLARQLLTESALLYLCGGALGLLLGFFISSLLRKYALVGEVSGAEIASGSDLALGLLLALVPSSLFSLVPLLYLSRARPESLLVSLASQATTSPRRLQGALVSAQLGLALVLVVGTPSPQQEHVLQFASTTGFRAQLAGYSESQGFHEDLRRSGVHRRSCGARSGEPGFGRRDLESSGNDSPAVSRINGELPALHAREDCRDPRRFGPVRTARTRHPRPLRDIGHPSASGSSLFCCRFRERSPPS